MPNGEELVVMLGRTLDQTGAVIAAVKPDQADLATPCASFDVRQLINHIVYDARMFAETSQGRDRPPAGEDLIGNDWEGAYDEAAAALLAVWQRPGATEGTIAIPQGELPKTW